MTETLRTNNTKKKIVYAFRFNCSNKLVRLNQKKLNCIPYLSALVEHKDDFLSIQNENGEYVLNPPIYYSWFIPILHSITSKQPYTLFTELLENENVVGTLQLHDYLNINSFSLPLLKGKDLVLLNPTNEKRRIEYHPANLSEARNTAAEFLIAISKNVYDLSDSDTMENLVSLIRIILIRADVFSSRFRHHTLTIVKECCFTFFAKKQRSQLITTHQGTKKRRKLNSLMYLYDDNNPLPDYFYNAFAWKGVYTKEEENDTCHSFSFFSRRLFTWSFSYFDLFFEPFQIPTNLRYLEKSLNRFETWEEITLAIKKHEAESARIKRFNTLPKRPIVDKFKHRSSPKPKKYR